jgi:hypothetical protein
MRKNKVAANGAAIGGLPVDCAGVPTIKFNQIMPFCIISWSKSQLYFHFP